MERTAYNYGDDTPAAWDVLARGALGRPISTRISPVLFLEELNEALLFAPPVKARLGQRPKPAGPGKTKALAASSVERPEETERRRAAQNDCRRLILPRTADEASDVFLRRLDAHQNAPEALVAPLSKPEDTKSFLRRMVAVKKNEAAGLLVMPRAKAETAEQFEARMALCEACPATVFARGAHEDPTDFKARLDAQSKCRRPIMCRSDGEPASLFRRRCAVSRACLDVVHPYDAARESADDFTRRMDAQEAAPELSIAPGDKKVVGSLVRESAEEGAAAMAEEIAAKLKLEEEAKAAAASKEEAAKAEAAAISKQRQRQDSMDDEAEAAKEAEERAAKKAAAAAAEAEKAAEEAEKAEKAKALWKFAVEKVDINSIGFMALKQMLISKGVPPDAVKVPNKFMLKEVAAKHGVNIEWS